MARCPAHEDETPSLSVTEEEGGLCLLHCFAGCTPEDVVTALQLDMTDLFPEPSGGSASLATRLVRLALDAGVELVHDEQRIAYATIDRDGHRETLPVKSPEFAEWLQHRYYSMHRRVPAANATADASGTLAGMARFDGPQAEVAVRLAGTLDRITLDLGDERWRTVTTTAVGWSVDDTPAARFRRPATLGALPTPQRGGEIEQLRPFVNFASESDFRLAVGWCLAALHPTGPYPVLVLLGEQGSAKSMTAEFLRDLVDPGAAARRSLPRSERDLVIAASNVRVLLLDNITKLAGEQSNALCRLSTGGGFSTRELYTDRGEVVFDLRCPVIVTGIEVAGIGQDLRERSIILELPPIEQYRDEIALRSDFAAARPRILGALLDALAAAIQRRPSVSVPVRHRMADAALWMTAAEEELGYEHGTLAHAFLANQRLAFAASLDHHPIVAALTLYLDRSGSWSGTAESLRHALTKLAPGDITHTRSWPNSAWALGRELRTLAPALRAVGIEVDYHRATGGKCVVEIVRRSDTEDAQDA